MNSEVPAYTTCILPPPRSRTSVDEGGNRHREVLSEPGARSCVNGAVVGRSISMAWWLDQRRPKKSVSEVKEEREQDTQVLEVKEWSRQRFG